MTPPAPDPSWRALLDQIRTDLRPFPYGPTLTTLADAFAALTRQRSIVRALPPSTDPAWSMILMLFVAEARGDRLSVSDLCAGSGASLTTAFRVLLRMEDRRMLVRSLDPRDHRRSLVHLGDDTRRALADAFADFEAALRDPPH